MIQQITEKDYYNKPFVSNSSLDWFKNSPKYFKLKLNKELEDPVPKKYFELGRQIHMFLLEPDEFHKNYTYEDVKLPSTQQQKDFANDYRKLEGSKEEKAVKAYKNNYSTKGKSEDKIKEIATELANKLLRYIDYLDRAETVKVVLSWNDWDTINKAADVVKNHKLARNLIMNTEYDIFGSKNIDIFNELVVLWKWNTVDCKSMLDRVEIDHTNKTIKLIDVKTTSFLGSFYKSVKKFRYNRQLAYYWLALKYWFKEHYKDKNFDDYSKESYIVAIGKGELVETRVFTIPEELLNDGLDEIIEIMTEIEWHYTNDKWDYSRNYYEGDGSEEIAVQDFYGEDSSH